jgi:N-acetyl-1-D-myo-inositol-2-amino-2-deoxy-alpha-D-glucopyranoside deacetylase
LFLGYQDGDVDQVPVEDGGRAVARLIRAVKADIVISHGPEGGYGHPDHIAVSALATRGFALAGDPAADVEGEPRTPAKLYYTATPRSFLEKVPAFRDRRADIRGQQLGFLGVADETITTVVSIADQRDLKLDALACHRTQFEMDPETGRPKFFATSIPEPERSQLFGFERFVLAHSHLSPNGVEDDLFAGLGQLW